MKTTTLDKLKIGQKGVVTEVGGDGELRCHLLDMGIIPRTEIAVSKVAPMGDPIELLLRGYQLSIRLDDARKIIVKTEDDR